MCCVGYFTLAAPKAMFFTQLLGECAGVIIAPMCFYLYNSAFKLGVPGTEWAAPFATLNRAVRQACNVYHWLHT